MRSFTCHRIKHLLCCLFFLQLSFSTSAQVFPGDANANGRINNIDLLYMGYAYGAIGPARQIIGMEPDIAEITAVWALEFPNGLNYAHSDADGNGIIDILDMLSIYSNYNQELDEAQDDVFITGNIDVDPLLDLETSPAGAALTAGSILEIPIVLGSPDQPLENITGLAFTIKYPAEFVASANFQFTADWFNPDELNGLVTFQTFEGQTEPGSLDVTLSRFGPDPVSGWGEIGVLSIIIEDDLIGLLPTADSTTLEVELTDVKGVNEQFEDLPIVPDLVQMMLYHPDALATSTENPIPVAISIFPNPVLDQLFIKANAAIDQVVLYDLAGQRILSLQQNQNYQADLTLGHLSPGLYYLKVATSKGQITQKISILK